MEQQTPLLKRYWFLIPIGISLNIVLSHIAMFFDLPFGLDSLGTIIVAALCGYLPGIVVGFFTSYFITLSLTANLYYSLIGILVAVVTAYCAERKVFSKIHWTLLCGLLLGLISGGIDSLLSWALAGIDFGTGLSTPLSVALYERLEWGNLTGQIAINIGINIIDKLISVLLVFFLVRIISEKFMTRLPNGYIYDKNALPLTDDNSDAYDVLKNGKKSSLRLSLRRKLALLIILTVTIVGTLAVSISFVIYKDTLNQRYIELGQTAVNYMEQVLDAEQIEEFYETQTVTPEYEAIEQDLYKTMYSMAAIEYMYVYKILSDGCHVIFDLDTPDLEGGNLGDIVAFDETFYPYLQTLFAGGEIDPIISNDQYGWLLTIYRPIRDANGVTVAYAAADIAMQDVMTDRYIFIVRMISLLLGVSILIIAFSMWYAQKRVISPLNALTRATSKFAYASADARHQNTVTLQQLNIKTGDEIENLYMAISKTTNDVTEYIRLINAQSSEVEAKAEIIAKMHDNIIISFANMVENRDENTGMHIKRTAGYVRAISHAMRDKGYYLDELSEDFLENIAKSAPLHDIGKIKISDTILNKPGKLTAEEFEIIKTHTTAGEEILRNVYIDIEEENYLSEAMRMAKSHHERWDGSGYPRGLAGEDIPLSARIMALADVFDALISKRSYKDAYSFEKAIDIIVKETGSHFDPLVVDAFLSIQEEIQDLSD